MMMSSRQRRAAAIGGGGGSAPVNHHAWGWAGDYVWIMLFVWVVWASMAFFWR